MFDILDCTIRDGGYYTDWDFSDGFVEAYLGAIADLPISCIEIGYRSPPKTMYTGRYFHLSRADILAIRAAIRPDQQIALMFNQKDVGPEAVDRMLGDIADTVDLVRFACPPDAIGECLANASVVARHGIGCMINVMYLNTWLDRPEILAPIAGHADKVQAVALVDSYGSCFPDQVKQAVETVSGLLPQKIGFHGHDNLQLAFANSLAALEGGAAMLDATMLGMGRGAGNLRTETALVYREGLGTQANIRLDRLAKLLETMGEMQHAFGWGSNLPYLISGIAELKQADVMDWLGKRRYTPGSIVSALRSRSGIELETTEHPDIATLAGPWGTAGRDLVVIGGGESVPKHRQGIARFLAARQGLLVHSSLHHADQFPDVVQQLFCLPGQELARGRARRAEAVAEAGNATWVVSAPPRFPGSTPQTGPVVQVAPMEATDLDALGPVSDVTPLGLALGAAMALDVGRVMLVGFDGYENATAHEMDLMHDIRETLSAFRRARPEVELLSLTPTLYQLPVRSLYAEW
ncbi:MAG: hypothetical protein AAF713_21915 [Pseudomonadota bacterium]